MLAWFDMELKKIFSKFRIEDKEEEKSFLAVEITGETIKSALWVVRDGKTKILKVGSLEEWDSKNKDLLLAGIDASITNASSKSKSEPEGVIFGLPESWVEKEDINEDKKELLKFICQKLELKPLGFVVITESLVAFLKSEEGTPLNAILINLCESESSISLVQLGKIKGTKIVGRSEDLAADVKEGLARFKEVENFPARMIIFNGTFDFEEYKQQLVTFDWPSELNFLHFPKVEVLESNESIKAVALAGGAEVAKSLGFDIKVSDKEEKKESEVEKDKEEEEEKEGEEKKEEETEEEKKEEDKEKQETSQDDKAEELGAKNIGFLKDQDVMGMKKEEEKKDDGIESQADEAKEDKGPKIKGMASGLPSLSLLGKLKSFTKRGLLKLKFLSLAGKSRKVLVLVLPLVVILALFGFLFVYLPKAKITVFLNPETLEEELKIIVDSSILEVDEERNIIPGDKRKLELEGSKSISTSGEKLVGEKAKGEVILYNKTSQEVTFVANTVLIGGDNLTFTLDEEVKIASQSAGEEGVTYGKSSVAVTAGSIGTESNLSNGSNLSFKSHSTDSYSGKAESGFSGGTSREVKVVSESDMKQVFDDLLEELKENASLKLKDELNEDNELLSEEISQEILNESYSAKEEEETDSLSLDLRVEFSIPFYKKTYLERLLSALMKDKVPDNFLFDPSKAEIEIKGIKASSGKVELETLVKAHLLPKTDFNEIKGELKGKSLAKAEEYLQRLANFSRAEIEITPKFLGILKRLPRLSRSIIIEVELEE